MTDREAGKITKRNADKQTEKAREREKANKGRKQGKKEDDNMFYTT
jgi:hypothetical protein